MTDAIENRPTSSALAERLDRLAALRSAFAALAPSALTDEGRAIADLGRELTQRLAEARRANDALGDEALEALDYALDGFEASMRRLAVGVPIAQLRATLPARLGSDRKSVLELLDLLLAELDASAADWANRIGTIDYLITLLCTQGARRAGIVTHDPAALTERLAALGRRAEETGDPRIEACEAEFFAAATMDRSEVREEFQRRALRQKKVELGTLFFAPRVLRAILTCNAALLERVTDEILEAGDWGEVEPEAQTDPSAARPSVYASAPLRRLAAAVRARIRGESHADAAEARIAAALGVEELEASARAALAETTVATEGNPIATAILVGMLCRKLAVLSIELQDVGIDPDVVSDVWVDELDAFFEREIDAKHADGAYKQAYALAELRNEFLLHPLADRLRDERSIARRSIRRSRAAEPVAGERALPPSFVRPTAATAIAPTSTTPGVPTPTEGSAATLEADRTKTPSDTSRSGAAPAVSAASTGIGANATAHADRPMGSQAPAIPARLRPTDPTRRPALAGDTAKRPRARDLVREALEDDRRGRERTNADKSASGRTRVARSLAAAVALLVIVGGAAFHLLSARNHDLASFSAEQLERVSPYLTEGRRNGLGRGPGFVGTLDERWLALDAEEREAAAAALVARLREHGLQQVMIYDRERRLRIQALGSQPIRSL